MRIAIVAESFLPNVNGVTNSVLRVLEHCRRTGSEAIVIAPDAVAGEEPAPLEHLGFPVYRVPARMLPKISSLPSPDSTIFTPIALFRRARRNIGVEARMVVTS